MDKLLFVLICIVLIVISIYHLFQYDLCRQKIVRLKELLDLNKRTNQQLLHQVKSKYDKYKTLKASNLRNQSLLQNHLQKLRYHTRDTEREAETNKENVSHSRELAEILRQQINRRGPPRKVHRISSFDQEQIGGLCNYKPGRKHDTHQLLTEHFANPPKAKSNTFPGPSAAPSQNLGSKNNTSVPGTLIPPKPTGPVPGTLITPKPTGSPNPSPMQQQQEWCQGIADRYGIVNGVTFGSAPSEVQNTWKKLHCHASTTKKSDCNCNSVPKYNLKNNTACDGGSVDANNNNFKSAVELSHTAKSPQDCATACDKAIHSNGGCTKFVWKGKEKLGNQCHLKTNSGREHPEDGSSLYTRG